MADEIQLNLSARLANGSLNRSVTPNNTPVTQAAAFAGSQVLSVTTSEADVTLSGIATNGFVFITNLDPTNFLIFGPKSGGSMVELARAYPGDPPAFFRLSKAPATLRWKADTATIKVSIEYWND